MRRRIAATAVLAAGLLIATAGCTFLTPQATEIKYDPSDGVSLNVGDLQVRNALVISPKGTDGNLVGVFINTSKSPIEVEVQYTSHGALKATTEELDIPLAAGQVLSLGNPGVPQEVFQGLNVPPGALAKVFVEYDGVAGKNVDLPVLINSDGSYNGDAPKPTPTPTPTATDVIPIPTSSAKP